GAWVAFGGSKHTATGYGAGQLPKEALMNIILFSTVRMELRSGKLCIYHNVTYLDYDDPLGRLTIYNGKQLLDAILLGYVKRWRFEQPRGPDRRQGGADRRPPGADRRQCGADGRRESANSQC